MATDSKSRRFGKWGLTPILLLLFAAVVFAHPEDEDILAELEAFGLISAEDPDPWRTVRTYVRVGVEHIVPKGLDHILFVLGLFLSTTRLKPLLIQVTSFTVAHTISLGLSMYGAISLPSNIVEPLIAFSIAWVGIENVWFHRMTLWRPLIVFGFGLLHGLGFASVLRELGLPRGEFLTGLLSFNVGVEIGQLTVILGAWLLLHWFFKEPWYRKRIADPLSLLIAAVGLYWTIQRIFFV